LLPLFVVWKKKTGQPTPFQFSSSQKSGFTDFHHKKRGIEGHGIPETHCDAVPKWKIFENGLKAGTLVDLALATGLQTEINFWKQL